MAYPKEKDLIFARQEKSENEIHEMAGFNFLRQNKFGLNVFSKKGELFVRAEIFGNGFLPEKMWRHYFKKKI